MKKKGYSMMPGKCVRKLDPIAIEAIQCGGQEIRFKKPLVFTPKANKAKTYYNVVDRKLGIRVAAQSRKDLIADITSDLEFVWREYAKADDKELTDDAIGLKRALLALAFDTSPDALAA
jgi:hypothetical protein